MTPDKEEAYIEQIARSVAKELKDELRADFGQQIELHRLSCAESRRH